jgi:hypothetical protein
MLLNACFAANCCAVLRSEIARPRAGLIIPALGFLDNRFAATIAAIVEALVGKYLWVSYLFLSYLFSLLLAWLLP